MRARKSSVSSREEISRAGIRSAWRASPAKARSSTGATLLIAHADEDVVALGAGGEWGVAGAVGIGLGRKRPPGAQAGGEHHAAAGEQEQWPPDQAFVAVAGGDDEEDQVDHAEVGGPGRAVERAEGHEPEPRAEQHELPEPRQGGDPQAPRGGLGGQGGGGGPGAR